MEGEDDREAFLPADKDNESSAVVAVETRASDKQGDALLNYITIYLHEE